MKLGVVQLKLIKANRLTAPVLESFYILLFASSVSKN